MSRLPRGYRGIGHETIGSDIIAIVKSMRLAESVLGAERVKALRSIQPDQWYPIATILEPLAFIEGKLGAASLKKIGWELFKLSHAAAFRAKATSVRDLIYGTNAMYLHANRGKDIGGWEVRSFGPGTAELECTTPHPCMMEEGIMEEALRTLNVPCLLTQTQCFERGHDSCVFQFSSLVRDARWVGADPS